MGDWFMPWNDNLDVESEAYFIASSDAERLRVLAGPGTGKSFAMKRRVGRLLEIGTDPARILPVTFTRVAAEDLHRELVGMGVEGCDSLNGMTLHSLALKILNRNSVFDVTGRYPRPLNDFELGPLESDLASHGKKKEIRKKMNAFSAAWARLQHDDIGAIEDRDLAFESDLENWLRFHQAMLIGEVIPVTYDYLSSNPHAPERNDYDHILVDEYQDLNKVEQALIEILSQNGEICIVGDDDQSIYSFKHANPEGIQEWLNPGDEDVDLTVCRRCPSDIVAMANSLICHNQLRPQPRILEPFPDNGQGEVDIVQYGRLENEVEGVGDLVQAFIDSGIPAGEILVLAQRNAIGTPIYEELRARGIPAKSYYAEAEINNEETQLRFSFLKLAAAPEDRVALRWLLGRGSATWLTGGYRRLRDHCEQSGDTPWSALEKIANGELQISHTAPLVQNFLSIRDRVSQLRDVFDVDGLPGVIEELFPEGDDRWRDLRELSIQTVEQMQSEAGNLDLVAFVAALTFAIAKPEIPEQIEDVRIMSLHKSKGLSAVVTIIAGCVEGLLPQRPDQSESPQVRAAKLEEDRRLFFVGITRVKAKPNENKPGSLILTYSRRMPMAAALGAGMKPAQISQGDAIMHASRFIAELGPSAPNVIAR